MKVIGAIIAALPEESRDSVLDVINNALVKNDYNSHVHEQLGSMSRWEFQDLKDDIKSRAGRLNPSCIIHETEVDSWRNRSL